ncbi:hypothetical protein PFISCL1PPCAC_9962 [Pristionchus fissidentatus]|uniref:Uncharacterized protein n=1 Tax=Pristionchus fissidentatus TaxID=1538716 RepID=A0AAV5VG57_9BILA|nr:hypothetical protein PFISCL1PPCAC_9962 [Pristionchus fissidentatus]
MFALLPFVLVAISSVSGKSDADCVCTDWYGSCRAEGVEWTDEGVWRYSCNQGETLFVACVTSSGDEISPNENITLHDVWHSCEMNEQRLRYERELTCNVSGSLHRMGEEFRDGLFQWLCLDTGRWVTGCFYKNETGHDVLLKIGQSAYNGVIKHVCDRYVDYPGRVQYYTQIRDDVKVVMDMQKEKNNNLPLDIQNRIHGKVNRWMQENAESFIAHEGTEFRARIRYLPASRRQFTAAPNVQFRQ